MRSACPFLLGVVVTLATIALAAHFRRQASPLVPEPFDPDMTELKIREASPSAEIVFLGDSLVDRWRFRPMLWKSCFVGVAANLGIPGARTGNLLWLVESGKLAQFHPQLWVISIGQNDRQEGGFLHPRRRSDAEIEQGVDLIARKLEAQLPGSRVLVMGKPQPADLADDGVHLNDAGYVGWCRAVEGFLGRPQP